MKRNLTVLLVLLIVVAGAVAALVLLNKSDDKTSTSNTSSQSQQSDETVIKVGTIECLSLGSESGQQNASCAIGLKQDEETAYALQSQDPTLTGGIPTGQRVQVTGTIVQNTSGVESINVKSIERL
jgi:flagellar basal body-associated protein FliL